MKVFRFELHHMELDPLNEFCREDLILACDKHNVQCFITDQWIEIKAQRIETLLMASVHMGLLFGIQITTEELSKKGGNNA